MKNPSNTLALLSMFQVFGKACKGYDMGDDVAGWLSKYILKEETGLRLLSHDNNRQSSRELHSTSSSSVQGIV